MTPALALSPLPWPYYLAPAGAAAALVMAFVFSRSVMSRPEGEPEMVRIADAVRRGAMAYLAQQYKIVAAVFAALVVVLGALSFGLHLQPRLSMVGVPIAGLLSGLCGWFGMKMATSASARTAFAAKQSLNDGLTVAFRSGAVMGLVVVGFALLDASVWFFLLTGVFADRFTIVDLTTVMLSFGMGASTQALFARVGGGIYTKAADVGADLVGKVEAGIPEDDPRNPATIADNVGDNVGDVAGMGADLYESYYGSILAAMALGAAAAMSMAGLSGGQRALLALLLATAPLALAGLGIFCSILGIFTVKAREGATFAQLLRGLHKGVWAASALIAALCFALFFVLFRGSDALPIAWWRLPVSIIIGLAAGNVIAFATEYYTSYEHPPTRRISEQALTGPATVIIAGIAEGMKSTWAALSTVVLAILGAYIAAGGAESFLMGLYGVGIAAVGMLSTLGITLATDAYGPIADNAGGNAEMSGQPPHVRERTDMLDSLGNTTAAMGKGFAIGSAALTALALFAAFVQVVQAQLTTQSASMVAPMLESGEADRIAAGTGGAFAVYEGHGKFAVVWPRAGDEPDFVDAGLFIPAYNTFHAEDHFDLDRVFDEGDSFPIGGLGGEAMHRATRYIISVEDMSHGHAHAYEVELASSRNGTIADVLAYYDVTLTNPRVLGGLFIGTMLTFLFCALSMSAVGRAAYAMMGECRRQFGKIREALRRRGMPEGDLADPDNWPREGVELDGHHYPDYATCVAISTAGAQREMIVPSLLAIIVPIAVGVVLSVPGVVGLLAGGLTSGFAVAIFMANAGGAWDNAKKFIESFGKIKASDVVSDPAVAARLPEAVRGALVARAHEHVKAGRGEVLIYGKGSEDHKATVVGDTVGDPFKDTSGPSLNILIKLISIVSVVFAGLTVKFGPVIGSWLGLG